MVKALPKWNATPIFGPFFYFDSGLIEFDLEGRSIHEIQVDTFMYTTQSTFDADETRISTYPSMWIDIRVSHSMHNQIWSWRQVNQSDRKHNPRLALTRLVITKRGLGYLSVRTKRGVGQLNSKSIRQPIRFEIPPPFCLQCECCAFSNSPEKNVLIQRWIQRCIHLWGRRTN